MDFIDKFRKQKDILEEKAKEESLSSTEFKKYLFVIKELSNLEKLNMWVNTAPRTMNPDKIKNHLTVFMTKYKKLSDGKDILGFVEKSEQFILTKFKPKKVDDYINLLKKFNDKFLIVFYEGRKKK